MKFKKMFLLMLSLIIVVSAQPTGSELLNEVTKVMNPLHSKGIIKQTIVTTSGDERVLTYEAFNGFCGEYSLMRYLSPSRVIGNAVLTTEYSDNIWMYNNRTKRVRKLASHAKKQKFEGSDFTYEDMGSGDIWIQNFNPENGGIVKVDNVDCYKLILVPNDKYDGSYSKIVLFARTSDYYPVRVNYFENGKHIKTCYLSNIQMIENLPTAMFITMKNEIDNTKTTMENLEVTYNVKFEREFFSERNLKR